MGIEFSELVIWIVPNKEIYFDDFLNMINGKIFTNFINPVLYVEEKKIEIINRKEIKKHLEDEVPEAIALFNKNIIDVGLELEKGKVLGKFNLHFMSPATNHRKIMSEQVRKMIFEMYNIVFPLFIRTATVSGAGDICDEEVQNKEIYSIHWMQIFSKEMLHSINVEKLKKSDKFYEVQDLPDGSIFIQITEDFGYTYKLIKELSDEIEIKCPSEYRWWEPKDI